MIMLCARFEGLGLSFKGGAGLFVPVEMRCLFGPEGGGVGEGVVLGFVLGVGHSGESAEIVSIV